MHSVELRGRLDISSTLRVEDLVEAPDGLRVVIRKLKTDQEGAGQEIAIPHGARLRPVEAVRAWLDAAGIASAPCSAASARTDASATRR